MEKFCPNCGHPIKEEADFCPNCGHQLKKTADKQETTPAAHTRRAPRPPHKPMSKKNKIIIAVVVVLVVAVGGLYAWGKSYYSRVSQVGRITQLIRNQDTSKLADLVVTDNSKVKINSSSVKSITRYYDGSDKLTTLQNTLSDNGVTDGVSLVQDGRYLLFFPKYKLKVKSYTPSVETNYEDSKVYVDGKYVATVSDEGNGEYSTKLKPMLGGKYTIKVEAQASGHKVSDSSEVTLWQEGKQFDYDIQTANLAILGPKDGKVYVGGKYRGDINKNGVLNLDDFQYSDETAAYIVYQVGDKKFTSQSANISDAVAEDEDNDSYDSDDSDDYLDQARNATNNYDSSVTNIYPEFDGAPELDTVNDLLKDCFQDPSSSSFVDGSSNKYYKSFKKMADGFEDTDKIYSWQADPDIYNVYPIGNGVFECNVKIDYQFEHSDDTHIQVAHYPHVTFKKVDGEFKILSVGDGKIIYDKTEED